MDQEEKKDPPSFWRELFSWRSIRESLIEDQKDALRFGRAGSIVGAILGAGAGIYLFEHFGWPGIPVLMVIGAVTGGIGFWLMHQFA